MGTENSTARRQCWCPWSFGIFSCCETRQATVCSRSTWLFLLCYLPFFANILLNIAELTVVCGRTCFMFYHMVTSKYGICVIFVIFRLQCSDSNVCCYSETYYSVLGNIVSLCMHCLNYMLVSIGIARTFWLGVLWTFTIECVKISGTFVIVRAYCLHHHWRRIAAF